ncbi:unnamed protein product [Miscanthus lutarioriparius]|uniref:Uncharacterized protein n=1 Tax=Miscanthus lutarioriparius TaxID=422564 RepID=A0A811Q8Y1_9POAL|nr:unnamed protein product [Miscanthus lutarioriparius]
MAAEPEDIHDEEPFSPSIFLNLSPTPPHPDDRDLAAASSSNSYHQYPNNHQAPQTSTEILSVSDPCIANTINGEVGTCFTLSLCFPNTAPVLDGVTWPGGSAPRDNDQRLLVEQDLFGRRVLNAVACEGFDRVERPETYKQWQARNDRAGLRQLPLDPDIVKAVSDKVRDNYHRDFVIYVDQKWLLQGWKGRTLYAMSTWVANDNDGISDPS